MGSIWTVTPESVRKELLYGEHEFWIELKKELTVGERKKLFSSGFRSLSQIEGGKDEDVELNVDWDSMVFKKVQTFLLDWSLVDDKGNKLSHQSIAGGRGVSVDILRVLKPAVFAVIEAAIDAHVTELNALEKKVMAGSEMPSEKISA